MKVLKTVLSRDNRTFCVRAELRVKDEGFENCPQSESIRNCLIL